MPLTSAITPYNESWPDLFRQEAARLRPVFGGACLDFEHVGSTAVEGLSSKAEIDMLVIVSSSKDLNEWEDALRLLGYRRGGDLSLNHHFFKRDFNDVRTHKLHICGSGHAIVRKMISLRDHLRQNTADRQAYQELKLRLERENRTGIAEYLRGKAPFLDQLYEKLQAEAKAASLKDN